MLPWASRRLIMSEEFWTKARNRASLGTGCERSSLCISTSSGGTLVFYSLSPIPMTAPTLNAASPGVPAGSVEPLAEKFPTAQRLATDVMLHAGQGGHYLDNAISTFRTTPMANLLLVDDEPKLIFKQVSHVFAPRGSQIEVVQS